MPALAGPWPMFGMDYLAIAVLELLQADALLQEHTKGAIFRRHVLTAEAEFPLPCILVVCQAFNEEGQVGMLKEIPRLGVLYCFSQFTKNLATGIGQDEPSVASLQAYFLSLLSMQAVNAYVLARFPELGAGGVKQLAVTNEFVPVHPIPIQDKNSIVAFAVGVEVSYAYWARYPSRLAA
jgi:hypothetical protein